MELGVMFRRIRVKINKPGAETVKKHISVHIAGRPSTIARQLFLLDQSE